MDKVKILLTAFRNTSSELIINKSSDYKKLLLPNDKIKDSEIVIDTISNDEYDYVFCFGQKPLLTDKVTIEIRLYFNCLKYIAQNKLNAKVIFIHIPTGKNISDIDMFFAGILKVISRYKM